MKQETNLKKSLSKDTRALRVISAGDLAYVCLMYSFKIKDFLQTPSPDYYLAAAWLCIILTLAAITYFAFSINIETFITNKMAKKVRAIGVIIGLLFTAHQWCVLHVKEANIAEPFGILTALSFVMFDIMLLILLLGTIIRDAAKIKQENDLTI